MAALQLLRRNIEYVEEEAKNQAPAEPDTANNETELPSNIPPTNTVIHIKLRSKYNHQFGLTLHLLEQQKLLDRNHAFKNFRLKTINFLRNTYNLTIVPPSMENVGFNFGQNSQSNVCLQIQEFRMLEVAYESQVHWFTEHDLLRASPNFHRKPRYDSVMVDTEDGPAFAKLLFLFSLKGPTHLGTLQLALIHYYVPIPPQMCPNTDKVIGFRRFKLHDEVNSSIISLESVIRGIFMAPTSPHNSDYEYFINDLIDGDIFIRMKRYNAQLPQL
jgi:hypothetical protein